MKNYSNASYNLPNEIVFFKQITLSKDDPIERYTFTLKEINYIVKNLSKFSVPSKDFFKIYDLGSQDKLINLLCENYMKSSIYEECDHIKKFISLFYDYTKPVYHNESYNLLWIYPSINIKNFIKRSMFENKTKDIYFDKTTLNKLISVFTNFTKHEYSNSDESISSLFDGLNYPSLILANIDLYEKGYIRIIEDKHQIKLFLNKKNKIKDKLIFSENREWLKNNILDFINISENTHYSLSDFL